VTPLGEWLESNSRNSGSRVVLAADVGGPYDTRVVRAASMVRLLKEKVVAVKLNWHLLLPFGVVGLRQLTGLCKDAGLPVIADMKLNDIGSTNVEAAQTLFSNGFDAVIANPFVGYDEGIGDLLEKSRAMGKGVILLVYMSHAGASEGYGLRVGGAPLYMSFARKAKRWGVDGAVVSSKSPAIIRRVRSVLAKGQLIFSPGVGLQGGDAAKAVAAGSDYVIVGRSIVDSKDPVASVDALNEQVARQGDARRSSL
jgi:orotidine-5'-phosphate decarboxylase